ncbi:unnamed protein product [Adineta ricciae]|uniref:Uncharacterized protein n=1 Tax=Adineta ricciae TaxID=249248 RepID=A0A813W8F9_ADIRI|nr:unnamed protein product [Adineta ricciae]
MSNVTNKRFNLSTYLLFILLLLLTYHFLCIRSFVIFDDDQLQNQLDSIRQGVIQQMTTDAWINSDDSSSTNIPEFQIALERRFCCMSPISGRKRFTRNLATQSLLDFLIK